MSISNNRLSPETYEQLFSDIHPPFETADAALLESNRCLFCYDAPCVKRCPTGINVPKFIKQIASGNVRGSAHTIFQSNIMGTGCGKVCPVEKLCEGACVFNLLDEAPIPIAKLQRYSTEMALAKSWQFFERKPATGKKVAIVGAGPAGLSCAHMLSREGVDSVIFEKEQRGGGLMTYGVAAYKVTPEFCQEEVDYITAIGGIKIEYGCTLGKDISLEALQSAFDAVYLAIGVGLAKKLDIPGEDLHGVEDALRFIYEIREKGFGQVPVGDKVAVIGMGMTAIDAATQAKRLGAKEVTLVYRRTEQEKPCTEAELDIARADGCRMEWLAAPRSILGENGSVVGLVCSRMRLAEADASGRRAPVDTGDIFTLDVDMVIKATGQRPFVELVQGYGIENMDGRIVLRGRAATNIPGVFAGGDAVNGGKEVVDAVQAGKEGAFAILEYLEVGI